MQSFLLPSGQPYNRPHFADEETEGQCGDGHGAGHPAGSEAPACLTPKLTSSPRHNIHILISLPDGRCLCLWGVAIFASFGMHLGTLPVDGGLVGSRRLLASWLCGGGNGSPANS